MAVESVRVVARCACRPWRWDRPRDRHVCPLEARLDCRQHDLGPRRHLTRIPNFRDVGGHRRSTAGTSGRGRLYRSVDLSGVEGPALGWLASLGLRTVIRPAHRPGAGATSQPPARRVPHVVALDVLADSGQADPAAFYDLMRTRREPLRSWRTGLPSASSWPPTGTSCSCPAHEAAFAELYRDLAQDGRASRPRALHDRQGPHWLGGGRCC